MKNEEYFHDMEIIDSDIMERVLTESKAYDPDAYTAENVTAALKNKRRTREDFAALLSLAAIPFLEEIAQEAQMETRAHFGNSVQLFTPLYLANYCENQCVYCGFNSKNKIARARLCEEEIEKEMQAISSTGLEEVLLLTGESRKMSDLAYIGSACKIAQKYFKTVGLEIYPVNSDEYEYLHKCGADFVTVFQETYNRDIYRRVHPAGRKRVFPYRFYAQQRALKGGIRGVGFAALLGLSDFRKDAFATGLHAFFVQRQYPHAEISFSCPRIRPTGGEAVIEMKSVTQQDLLQIIAAYRLFMPFAGITISSRESRSFRDNIVKIAATKISASVNVGVGEHSSTKKGDEQFLIDDARTAEEIYESLKKAGMQPVMSDYLYI